MDKAEKKNFTLTVLGARGSVPVDGSGYAVYGGATSCYMVRCGERIIFLDAGTGILSAPDTGYENVAILLSHAHLDHINGLSFYKGLTVPDKRIDIYGKRSDRRHIGEAVRRLYSPPFWPVHIENYPADTHFYEAESAFDIGDVHIEVMDSNHPNGSVIYKLTYEGRSLIYATDYEHDDAKRKELTGFCRDAELVMYDAQYTEEDYMRKRGYGHSTVREGLRLLRETGAKRMLFVHHDPDYTDEFMDRRERELGACEAHFAKRMEVLAI